MTIAESKQFMAKNKLIIYIKAFIKLYQQRNHKQVYKIEKIIELKK